MKSLVFVFIAVHMVVSIGSAQPPSFPASETGSNAPSEGSINKRITADENGAAGSRASQRMSSFMLFEDLAPRQKVMGVVNAIALLRTKISLIEEMRTAFEPRASTTPTGPLPTLQLPGPALAYGDCRLGILGFDVCRHLGFLESDPMVAPSSTQSKLLTLLGASSLITSLKRGRVNLHEDPDLNAIMGPELVDAAMRALGACWNSQLLLPAFDARPVSTELMREATHYTDSFLFLTAMQAKHIIRFSRSDYEDVASWLAWIFSTDAPSTRAHREGEPQRTAEGMDSKLGAHREDEPQHTAESMDSKPTPARHETPSAQKDESWLLRGFLHRLFSNQSQQPSQSQSISPAEPPTIALPALTNSVEGLTSILNSTARNAFKLVNGEAPAEDVEASNALDATEKRLEDILSMIPEEVTGQF